MTIYFYSKSPQFGWLSNFSEHCFVIDSVSWPTVEHFYQARKFASLEIAERIRQASKAAIARKIGQNRSLTVRPDWEDVRVDVMRAGVRAKFVQNRSICELLLTTKDEELVHESTSDFFWGRDRNGNGINQLGTSIMDLRNELRESKHHAQS